MKLFLWLPGVKGDATEEDHVGEIDLHWANFENSSAAIGGGTGGVQKVHSIHIGKKNDNSSNALVKAATSGQIFGKAVVDNVAARHTHRYTMTFAQITSFNAGSDGFENVTISFETMSYKQV